MKRPIRGLRLGDQENIKSLSESILLTYFDNLVETMKPSSLWAHYSMLRSMINIKHKINISSYSSLIAFLKQQNKGFSSKKFRILSAEHVSQFLREAPDDSFLAIKVIKLIKYFNTN